MKIGEAVVLFCVDGIQKGSDRRKSIEDVFHQRISFLFIAVAGYYDQFGKVVRIQGEGDVDTIFDALCDEIEAKRVL